MVKLEQLMATEGLSGSQTAPSSMTHGKSFPLLDLPAEIWIKIGQLAIDATPRVHVNTYNLCGVGNKVRPSLQKFQDLVRQPAITATCRILRAELLPYAYQNQYLFRCFGDGWDAERTWLSQWLRSIGAANRESLRGVELMAEPKGIEESRAILRRSLKVAFELGVARDIPKDDWDFKKDGAMASESRLYSLVFTKKSGHEDEGN
ncbi:hypothetical protein LTS10_010069 [Elasticomyces elasticus]|nr:hypothetical protein LTS10_010069 [Elasticomyces elasticus]